MDVKLSKESAYFLSEAKRLRKLLRETQRCFNDINTGGCSFVCCFLFSLNNIVDLKRQCTCRLSRFIRSFRRATLYLFTGEY